MKTIGIDLGTTNTVAGIAGAAVPLASEQAATVMPSVVAWPPNGHTLVGTAARRRRAIDGRNTIYSAKRLIGRTWHSQDAADARERFPFSIVEHEGAPAFKTRAGVFTPVDVGALILARVFADIDADLASSRIAVAVPSAFDRQLRQATADAVRQAGADNVEIVDEPIATSLAYVGRVEPNAKTVAVYDLGGGTFELAIVDCTSKPFKVLANKGDLYLGGDDIDHAIANWVADEVLHSHRWDLRDSPVVFDRLVVECERAKIRLCYAEKTQVELSQVDPAVPGGQSAVTIGQDRLTELCDFLVKRTFVLCDQVLADARLKASQLDAVFLAGGTTQLPMVRRAVSHYFGRTPRADFDPMEVVGLGASITLDDSPSSR